MWNHQAIRTKKEYAAALAEIERLLEHPEGSPQERDLETVSILVEAYESANDEKIPDADPIEVLAFVMEQQGLTRADLEPMIGPSGRVSEVMTYKRPLTLAMMRALSERLHIPLGTLATDYKLKGDSVRVKASQATKSIRGHFKLKAEPRMMAADSKGPRRATAKMKKVGKVSDRKAAKRR